MIVVTGAVVSSGARVSSAPTVAPASDPTQLRTRTQSAEIVDALPIATAENQGGSACVGMFDEITEGASSSSENETDPGCAQPMRWSR